MKTLEIGKNYGGAFGLNEEKGQKMIYGGGDKWTAIDPVKGSTTVERPQLTKVAIEHINKQAVHMAGGKQL